MYALTDWQRFLLHIFTGGGGWQQWKRMSNTCSSDNCSRVHRYVMWNLLEPNPKPISKSLRGWQAFPTGDIVTGAIVAGANVGSPYLSHCILAMTIRQCIVTLPCHVTPGHQCQNISIKDLPSLKWHIFSISRQFWQGCVTGKTLFPLRTHILCSFSSL